MKRFACLLLVLGCATTPEPAEKTGNQLIQESHDVVGGSPSFKIVQTVLQTAFPVMDGQRAGKSMEIKQESTMEVVLEGDMTVRFLTRDRTGEDIEVIRQGEKAAIKIGDLDWTRPEGPYAAMGDQLANPFSCPLPVPGPNSPQWEILGEEEFEGRTVILVETVGDSAVAYAEQRMKEAMGADRMPPGVTTDVEVHKYKSLHRIAKDGLQRLQVVQTSTFTITMKRGEATNIVDVESVTTSTYADYGTLKIEIPEKAAGLLEKR